MTKYYVDVYVRTGYYKRTAFDSIVKARAKAISEIELLHPRNPKAEVDVYYGNQIKGRVFKNWNMYPRGMYLYQEKTTNRNFWGHQHTYECFKNGKLGEIVVRG